MKNVKRVLSLLLCLMMVITAVPMGAVVDSVKAFAAEVAADNTVDISAEKTEVDAFIKSLMDANDPATVVKNFGTHLTWDNEKRESS